MKTKLLENILDTVTISGDVNPLVGRLLTSKEIDFVEGGAGTHAQAGHPFTQSGGGDYKQGGTAGPYTQSDRSVPLF